MWTMKYAWGSFGGTYCVSHPSSFHDQIAHRSCQTNPGTYPAKHPSLFVKIFQARLYPASIDNDARAQAILQHRFQGYSAVSQRHVGPPRSIGTEKSSVPRNTAFCRTASFKNGILTPILDAVVRLGRKLKLIPVRLEGAVDGTGFQNRQASLHYLNRRFGKAFLQNHWCKLTVLCDTASYFWIAATVSRGPSNDSPEFAPVVKQAARRLHLDRVLADAAFDSEANHAVCRTELGIRSTVIPLNQRGNGRKWPKTRFRRQMKKRFHSGIYHSRVHVEGSFSQDKRRLGSALRNRSEARRAQECLLRVITHNIMLLRSTG
jgi:hypothetical protein